VPPVSIDTTISTLEEGFTSDFESYLGLEGTPIATLDEARQIAADIERATGVKPAFVYVSFVPPGVNLLANGPIPRSGNDELELVVVTKDVVIRRRIPGVTRDQVLAKAQEFRGEITNPRKTRTTSYLPSSQQLYQWLVAPVAADLETQGINNLVFLPDAGLRSLPFAALHDGQQFLVQKYSVGLMPSLSLTDTRYEDIRNSSMLAMGISESTEGQAPLPAARIEVTTVVSRLWRGKFVLDDQATLENLEQIRQETPFGIIHMATHADFVGGPIDNSYIQLWNHKLRMDQVRQLGWNNPPVNMLVLSACRTALGNEEAELGFAGLAVQTGVKTAVASLWYVSDVSTAALMTGFYSALSTAPIKAEALREAQVAMITGQVHLENGRLEGLALGSLALPAGAAEDGEQTLAHPYYWAAFTMVGNPW
jgi:CHAT domain-containing protein